MRGEQKSSSRGVRLTNTPNRRSHEERRVEIADAALRLIATEGIASLTVATLANELGLTERAVELLDASLPDPSLSPMVWLEQFVDSRTRAVSGHKGLASLIISDQLAKALPETAFEHLRGAVRRTFVQVERALLSGQSQGQIRQDLSARELAPVVMGIVQMIALSRSGSLLGRATSSERTWHTLRTLLLASAS